MAKTTDTKKTNSNLSAEDKAKALQNALKEIDKKFGDGAIMRLGAAAQMNVSAVPTGSVALDLATGIGGLPRGRIIEIYGPESSGKTTLALHAVAEVQKAGGEAAFIDAEHALDPIYAKNIGVDIDRLLISQPDCGEQALEIAETLTRSGAIEIIVIDSVAALVPKAEISGEMGDSHVGLHARLMSQALRKLAGSISRSNTIIIFINQLREKVGVMYGNPEVTTGGRALKFYASMRLDVRPAEKIKDSEGNFTGTHTRVKIVKNKVAPPFKEAEFDIIYGKGIAKDAEIFDLGVRLDIIEKSGSWFSYNGQRLAQGRDKSRELIAGDAELFAEITEKVTNALKAFYDNNAGEPDTEDDGAYDEDGVVVNEQPRVHVDTKAQLAVSIDDDDDF